MTVQLLSASLSRSTMVPGCGLTVASAERAPGAPWEAMNVGVSTVLWMAEGAGWVAGAAEVRPQ
jgi:hypothetical protein